MDEKEKICLEFLNTTRILKRYIDNSSGIQYAEKYTGNNIWILGYLYNHRDEDIFQKDLENKFSVRRSTISKAIRLMEKKGLIKRVSVEHDARLKKILLTDKSLEIHGIVEMQMREMGEKFFANFTNEEIECFSKILVKIKDNFKDECGEPHIQEIDR